MTGTYFINSQKSEKQCQSREYLNLEYKRIELYSTKYVDLRMKDTQAFEALG